MRRPRTPSAADLGCELARDRFVPPLWLRGAFRQTVAGTMTRFVPRPGLKLERWSTPDDDFIRVHIKDGVRSAPAVLILHGLEGSVASRYVAGVAAAVGEQWGVCAMEYRSCGGEMNRARRTYHSGETLDPQLVVEGLRARWPGRALCLAGFSLGGNVLLKWLAERADSLPPEIAGAAAVSTPFDLAASAGHVDRHLGGFYVRHFLKTMIPKAVAKASQYPGCIDVAAARRSRTFAEFDAVVTAPLHGFRDAEHYWAECSSGRLLDRVRCPTLLISSRDDPINPASTLPVTVAAESPYLLPLWTDRGGHTGFVERGAWRGPSWADRQIARFFARCRVE